jgi:hypothetical protein
MLSSQQIHFNIVNQLTLGSYTLRDYEAEELDYIINSVVYDIINNTNEKDLKDRTNVEEGIIRRLMKSYCTLPTNVSDNEWKFSLPQDFSSTNSGEALVYDTTCTTKVTKIKENKIYKALGDVQYNGVWYKKCDIIIGDSTEDYYGDLIELESTIKPATDIDYNVYNLYKPSSSIRYTIEGNTVKIKSKYAIARFCLSYTGQLLEADKINHCIGQTLNFPETIQHYVINKVVLKLSVITDESQQKVINLKTVNITQ